MMYPFKDYFLRTAIGINLLYMLICVVVFLFNMDYYGTSYSAISNTDKPSSNHPISLVVFAAFGIPMYLFLYWRAKRISEWRFWLATLFSFFMFTLIPVWCVVFMLIEI